MENASKALIMAGGVLIALMVLGALMLMFNNLSSYQDSTDENLKEAQIVEFNNQFTTYDRNDVRGNELYSLLNRVVDYNERKSSVGTIGKEISYEPMTIKFSFVKELERGKLAYNSNNNLLFTEIEYEENSNQCQFQNNIIEKIKTIEENEKNINTLVLNIVTILDHNDLSKYREITGDEELTEDEKKDILKYYEFVQFKRAHFDCTNVEYNKNTGRVIKMEFKFNGKIG